MSILFEESLRLTKNELWNLSNSELDVGHLHSSSSIQFGTVERLESPDWLKVDKLNLETLSLYGRDAELSILHQSLEQISIAKRHFVVISGDSGTGKSALAKSLKDPIQKKTRGLLIQGKFDFQNNQGQPYSGIISACVEICNSISNLRQQGHKELFETLLQRIRTGLGSELALLCHFIPDCSQVLMHGSNTTTGRQRHVSEGGELTMASTPSSEEAKNRFHFAFQRFIRIIAEAFQPLVLVLDDLQRADAASLELLEICLTDSNIQNLLVIGTFRSAEVDHDHILRRAITRFNNNAKEGVFQITQIFIDNLDFIAVNRMVASLLSMDQEDDKIEGLSQVCYKKTQGNPFFVLQFLHMLRNTRLLKYNFATFSWNWNIDEIHSYTSATSNVVDLLKVKMAHLPPQWVHMLKIAACLGSTFNETCLRYIWESTSPRLSERSDSTVALGLEFLEKDGYILKRSQKASSPSQGYCWTHDKIQEAAFLLIPAQECAAFLRNAGDILLSRLNATELDSAIFVVANLLNAGDAPARNDPKRLIIARLNHAASLRALSISAFDSVADYAGKGIRLLPNNHWEDHYELSLGLYSVAAQAEGFLGNVPLMEQYSSAVLAQEERPMSDKMLVYHTLVNSRMTTGQLGDAAKICFDVLEIRHCHFPKNPVSLVIGLVRTALKMRSVIKSLDPTTISKSNDPMMFELMQLMDKLAFCLYMKQDPRGPLVIFRILDWTIKHGQSDHSSVAFAFAGLLLIGFLNDLKGGTWYGEQALLLMEKSQSTATRSRTMFIVYTFVFIWTRPLMQLLKPLLQSYHQGLQCGDQDSAAYSIVCWMILRYLVGNPLHRLEKDVRLYAKQMKAWKVMIQMDMTFCCHQAILILMNGRHNDSLDLIGEIISEEDHKRYSGDFNVSTSLMLWEGVLSAYFGDHVRHAFTALQCGHDYQQKRYPSSPYVAFDSLMKGISCFAAAKQTGNRKYFKLGEKFRSKIRRWREMGNPNVMHYEAFLDAESAAFQNHTQSALLLYEQAIIRAGRTGFVQDAAFACERLAEFHLDLGDEREASYRMGQALRYWTEWGALAKAEDLKEKHYHLLKIPQVSNSIDTTSMVSQNQYSKEYNVLLDI